MLRYFCLGIGMFFLTKKIIFVEHLDEIYYESIFFNSPTYFINK